MFAYLFNYIFFNSNLQISEKDTGPPPIDESSIDDESLWICHQLATNMTYLFGRNIWTTEEGGHELSIIKEDIMRFLEYMHVQKFDVSNAYSGLCIFITR